MSKMVKNIDVLKPLTVVMPIGCNNPLKAKVYTSHEVHIMNELKKGIDVYVKLKKK